MKTRSGGFVYWTPRILSIIFILFLMLFSLDVFSLGLGLWETLAGLIMHNIPAFLLATVLAVSWRHEIVGGIAYILAGILYLLMILSNVLRDRFEWYMISWAVTIAGPAFLIGILFLIGWFRKRKYHANARKN